MFVQGKIVGALITVINVYAPQGSACEFYRQIFDKLLMESDGLTIVGGDFHLNLNPNMDSTGTRINQFKNIAKKVGTLTTELGIADVWRENNWTIKDYTYFSSLL